MEYPDNKDVGENRACPCSLNSFNLDPVEEKNLFLKHTQISGKEKENG